MFVIAGLAAFAGFAVTGMFMAVAPSFVAEVAASIFAASAVTQVAARGVVPQRAVAIGCGVLVAAMTILVVALYFSSLAGLVAGGLVAGVGHGMTFSRGLAAVVERTPTQRRAEVSSTYFVVAYVAISLPVVGEGLAAQAWGLRTDEVSFAVAVAILAGICLVAILAQQTRESRRAGAEV